MRSLTITVVVLMLGQFNIQTQNNHEFHYEIDIITYDDDAFHVSLTPPELGPDDQVYSFVSYAPGAHQPLDFGRFVKSFQVFDVDGNELLTQKLSTNDWKIYEPHKIHRIDYIIDDSRDMAIDEHPIYPMCGTGIEADFSILNLFGIVGYFHHHKSSPVSLQLKSHPDWITGTALQADEEGIYHADSYYHLADSPILTGKLTKASKLVGSMNVDAYVFSPTDEINADMVITMSEEILNSAYDFIGFAAVDRYTFLMYFHDPRTAQETPILNYAGALEHSYSSTYALPAMPAFLPMLNDIIAHEFMHILTPLNLRSEIIANFDYSMPTSEDQHLWLYEGVTEWVAHNMQLRSGLITTEEYLDRISNKIRKSENFGCEYSLKRLSTDWSTDEGHKQYGNIYQLGALTANALDIRLLQLSNGHTGLRDVYLALINKYGKNKPFDNATFFDEITQLTYPEINDFIDAHISKCTPFDYKAEFSALGINYYPEKAVKGNGPILGLNFTHYDGHLIIMDFVKNHKDIGLKRGDRILKIFDREISAANSGEVLAIKDDMQIGDPYEIVIDRRGEELVFQGELIEKISFHVFELDEHATRKQAKLRAAWTGAN